MAHVIWDYILSLWHYWWLCCLGFVLPINNIWKWLHPDRKEIHFPFWLRLTIALTALFLGQFLAYKDQVKNLSKVVEEKRQLSIDKDSLTRSLSLSEQERTALKQQLSNSQSAIQSHAQTIYRNRPASNGADDAAQAERRKIQDKCAEYVAAAKQIEQGWIARLGKSKEEQGQSALAANKWHSDVEHYLGTIPRGNIYLAKFATPVDAGNAYPVGINLDLAGIWQTLLGDMKTLTDIMSDPDLGRP